MEYKAKVIQSFIAAVPVMGQVTIDKGDEELLIIVKGNKSDKEVRAFALMVEKALNELAPKIMPEDL